MADLSDVTAALGLLIQAPLYPTLPASGNSTAGMPVLIGDGWPSPQSLDAAMAAGKAMVTIYPIPGERNTTRYPKAWQSKGLKPATFTLTGAGQTVSAAGVNPAPFYQNNFAVFVNGAAYLYQAKTTDGPNDIAVGLQAVIVVDVPGTTVSGAVVTLPAGARIGALRVGTGAPVLMEVRRQERRIQISIWANNPARRDAIAKVFDPVLANTPRFTLPDSTVARLLYQGSPFNDFDQKYGIFRRDLIYQVEYATTLADVAPEAIAIKSVISQQAPDGSTITPPIVTQWN